MSGALADFLRARLTEDEAAIRRDESSGTPFTISPDQMLAECEAKRRIVDIHHPLDGDPEPFCWNCDEEAWPCRTMAALALPYADHPNFREEWSS